MIEDYALSYAYNAVLYEYKNAIEVFLMICCTIKYDLHCHIISHQLYSCLCLSSSYLVNTQYA